MDGEGGMNGGQWGWGDGVGWNEECGWGWGWARASPTTGQPFPSPCLLALPPNNRRRGPAGVCAALPRLPQLPTPAGAAARRRAAAHIKKVMKTKTGSTK